MYEKAQINTQAMDGLLKKYKGELKFVMDTPPYFLYKELRKKKNDTVDILALVENCWKTSMCWKVLNEFSVNR